MGGELEASRPRKRSFRGYSMENLPMSVGGAAAGGGGREFPLSPDDNSVDSSSTGGNGGNGMPKLNITRQPPAYAFADDWFDIKINHDAWLGYFAGPFGAAMDAVELKADLHGCDTSGPWPEPIRTGARVVVDGPGESIRMPLKSSGKSRRGTSTNVRCKINAAVRSDRLTQYCIRFSPMDGQGEALLMIRPVFTRPIIMITGKLKVETEDWEEVWYKDEGGRDKCMRAQAVLCDKDGAPIQKRKVPLKLTLLYDNKQSVRVMKQDILRVFGPPRQSIDPATAAAKFHFRIDDVSKNHQGMAFRVEVGPDTSRVADVAPAVTPSVSVRSKRNKPHKRQRSASSGTPPFPDSGQTSSVAAPQLTPPQGSSVPPSRSPIQSYPAAGGDQTPQAGFTGVTDIPRLRQAMKGVIEWTGEVVNGLYPLKWEVMGYAQFPDGTIDYDRPYYSMPNPNTCISRILSLYSDETREHLRVLLTAVENTNPTFGDRPYDPSGSEGGYRGVGPQAPAQQGTAVQQSQGQTMNQSAAAPFPYASGASSMHGPQRVMPGQAMGHRGVYTGEGTPLHGRVRGPPPPMQQWHTPPQYAYSPPGYHPAHPTHLGSASQGRIHPPQPGLGSSDRGGQMAPPEAEATQEGQAEEDIEAEAGRADIEYILAKPFNSLRSGERLGFPCYGAAKEIIGFIRESSMKVGMGQFTPISKHRDEFGPMEMSHASRILQEAMDGNSQSLHSKEAWGTVASLIDHALVYEWSKEIPETAGDSNDNH